MIWQGTGGKSLQDMSLRVADSMLTHESREVTGSFKTGARVTCPGLLSSREILQ